jgi:putative transposase
VKYAWIDSQRTHFPIELMCQVLEVSRSGFFAWRQRQALEQPDPDARVRDDLRDLHQQSRRLYGRRRLVHALRTRGHCINPKRVRRLMREEGLRGVRKGRFVPRTTDGNHDRAIACNVLARRFSVDAGVAGWVLAILPTCRLAKAGCTWRSLSRCTRVKSSATVWRSACEAVWIFVC